MGYIGEPFLAAISKDATLRLYRLTAGVFSQVGSRAINLPFGIPGADAPQFAKDGAQRMFWAEPNVNDNSGGTSFQLNAAIYGVTGISTPNVSGGTGSAYPTYPHLAVGKNFLYSSTTLTPVYVANQMLTIPANVSGTGQNRQTMFDPNGGDFPYRSDAFGAMNLGVNEGGITMSPDLMMIGFNNANAGNHSLWTVEWQLAAAGSSFWQGYVYQFTGQTFWKTKFSDDSNYYIATKKDGTVSVYQFTHAPNSSPVLVGAPAVTTVDKPVMSLAVKGKFVAVGQGVDSGGGVMVYTTTIFQRIGKLLVKITELADIGGDVLFSEDGSLLVDAVAKKAYTRSGNVFTAADGMMANISGVVVSASLSPHLPNPPATTAFYDGAVGDFSDSTIDLSALKVLLVGNNIFVPAQTTIAAAIASATEVYGNGWPQGGKALGAATPTKDASGRVVKAAKVTQGILGGSITARAAIIYTGTRPLMFLDFKVPRTVEAGSTLEIDVNTNGFLTTQSA